MRQVGRDWARPSHGPDREIRDAAKARPSCVGTLTRLEGDDDRRHVRQASRSGSASTPSSWRCSRSTWSSSTARRTRSGSRKRPAGASFWVALSLVFNVVVWRFMGPEKGLEFLTGYLIEKSLSVDNIFVFVLIFSYFAVPAKYQHRVLFWGILGALVMRGAMIVRGRGADPPVPLDHLRLRRVPGLHRHPHGAPEGRSRSSRSATRSSGWCAASVPVTNQYHGQKFFIIDKTPPPPAAWRRRCSSCWCWSRRPT